VDHYALLGFWFLNVFMKVRVFKLLKAGIL